MDGKGANPASVTVYGPGGADDVATYNGISTSSDSSKYSFIEEGYYLGGYQDMATSPFGTAGAKKRRIQTALTYRVSNLDGTTRINPEGGQNKNGKDYMEGIFLHRTNWSGKASGGVSQGCLIIDGRQWKQVEGQLG